MLDITTKRIDFLNQKLQSIKSMRFTIVATYFAVVLIALILMIVYTLGLLSDNLYNDEYVNMFTKANIIAESVSMNWDGDPAVTADRFRDNVENSLAGTNIRGVVTNTSYTILYDTNIQAGLIGKVFMRDVLKYAANGEQRQLAEKNESGGKMISVAVPVKIGDDIAGCVYLAQNITSIDTTVSTTRTSMVVFSILILFLIGLLSLGISYVISAPIEQFVAAAKEISKGNFSIRMKGSWHNEINQMSETFNFMCEELENLEVQRRKFVSDASHELKTPMAGIKLICDSIVNAENIDIATVKDFLNDMSAEVERLTRIVERLLVLTKLNSGGDNLHAAEIDVKAMIDRIIKKLEPLAEQRDVVIYADYGDAMEFAAVWDYDKIYEAIYNIADNAVKYTIDGGFVHITLQCDEETVKILVEDNGAGIPQEAREKIFERFYRLDDSRARDTGGTGLGLAIAKEAVLMHRGTIEIICPENGGSIFVIQLPRSVTEGIGYEEN